MSTGYFHTEVVHNYSAAREVVPLVMSLVNPASVLDVGCGIGTWLKVFEENGIQDYLGVDGKYVDLVKLKIPASQFYTSDLNKPLYLNRKFDLVLSLEVAEHIEEKSAEVFIESLLRHGDVHLFSAAIPGQLGQNHINEQWPEYWEKKFAKFGFYFHDVIRPEIWNNERVDFWYRQNIFLVKKEKPSGREISPMSMVHPRLFELTKRNEKEYIQSLLAGRQGIRMSIGILFKAIMFKIRNLLN